MCLIKKYNFIVLGIFFIACSNYNEFLEQAHTQLDSTIQAEIDNDNIPGAVILISHSNNIIYYKAYGYAQKYAYGREPLLHPVAMQKNTLFDLASLTKVFATTYAVMLCIDMNLFDLNDPVAKHLPGFHAADKRDITIRNLLTSFFRLI